MPTYHVLVPMVYHQVVEVEAESPEDAARTALDGNGNPLADATMSNIMEVDDVLWRYPDEKGWHCASVWDDEDEDEDEEDDPHGDYAIEVVGGEMRDAVRQMRELDDEDEEDDPHGDEALAIVGGEMRDAVRQMRKLDDED